MAQKNLIVPKNEFKQLIDKVEVLVLMHTHSTARSRVKLPHPGRTHPYDYSPLMGRDARILAMT